MGAGLVLAALRVANTKHLEHAPTRLYMAMSARALDSDPEPNYWGGRDALSEALGNRGSAGHRAVTRALAALTRAGAIRTKPAAPNRNARHYLMDGAGQPLTPAADEGRSPSLDEATKDAHRPSNEGRSADQRRTLSVPTKDAHRPPEEDKENKEEGRPSPFCDRHQPRGTSTPCGACGEARKRAEQWKPPSSPVPPHLHRFDPVSGYCGCGIREDAA